MKRVTRIGVACIGLLLSVSAAAQANLITNGSFEDTLGVYPDGAAYITIAPSSAISIPGWDVASGSVDWINSYWVAKDGTKSLDLAGHFQHGLVVGTSFNTIVGQTYRVQFDMAGNPDQPYSKTLVSVAINDASGDEHLFSFDQTGNTKSNMGWQAMSFDFVADATISQLYFGDRTNYLENPSEAWGAALDNVSVDLAPVPEPSTFVLFGVSLAALVGFRRKLRRSER